MTPKLDISAPICMNRRILVLTLNITSPLSIDLYFRYTVSTFTSINPKAKAQLFPLLTMNFSLMTQS